MNLILTIKKSPPGGAPAGTSRTFDESGTTVGRHEKNGWALPSVEGDGLSRFHCRIVFEHGAFSVVDTNSTYGLLLNDVRVKAGGRAFLKGGDRLRLGEYELLVELEAPAEPVADEQPQEPAEPDALSGITPFEWDPPEPTPPAPEHLMDEDAPMRDDSAPEMQVVQLPKARGGRIPDDWMNPRAQTAQAEPIQPMRQAPPVQPVRRSPPSADGFEPQSSDGFASFLAGAALQRAVDPGLDPNTTMRAAGETFRVAVEGIREILASRTQIKDEFRIEKTRVAVAENNPLKFSASAEEALSMMIGGNRSGFVPPSTAMKEALRDIKEHEMALIAAIQVALTSLLEQIDPKTLEARLEKRWLLDDFVPGARKARIWETYETKHAEIARELEEDFQGAFGRAFAQAYEQYVRQR